MPHLKDILGYKKQVEILNRICDFLKNTDKYLQYGVTVPKGMLIYGQSGVGKTFMAEALMTDCERYPIYIDCAYCDSKEISKQFKKAKKIGFSVILLDKIDVWNEDGDEIRQLIYEFENISGKDVFVIVTAQSENDIIDFLQCRTPLEYKLELESPELEDAKLIYKRALADINIDKNFNYDDFCRFSDYMTYPEIEQVLNHALLLAIYEGSGCVSMTHIVKARLSIEDSALADEYDEKTAYHEASHAAVHMLLGGKGNYIIIYSDGGGLFKEDNFEEKHTYEEKERRYIVGAAGRASAEIFFGIRALGIKTDLKNLSQRLEYDLSNLATAGFNLYDTTSELNSPDYNDRLAQSIQEEMQKYYDRAKELLEQNKLLVKTIAERLKDKHYLLSSELNSIYSDYIKNKK